jgi:hypothetical protein
MPSEVLLRTAVNASLTILLDRVIGVTARRNRPAFRRAVWHCSEVAKLLREHGGRE